MGFLPVVPIIFSHFQSFPVISSVLQGFGLELQIAHALSPPHLIRRDREEEKHIHIHLHHLTFIQTSSELLRVALINFMIGSWLIVVWPRMRESYVLKYSALAILLWIY